MLWVLLFCARSGEITVRINDVEMSNSTFENIVRDFGDTWNISEISIKSGHLTYRDLASLRNVTFEAEYIELIEFQENCSIEGGTISEYVFEEVTCGTIRIESSQCYNLSLFAFFGGVFDNIIANRVTHITGMLDYAIVNGSLELNAVETVSDVEFRYSSVGTFEMNSVKSVGATIWCFWCSIESFIMNGITTIEQDRYVIFDNSELNLFQMNSLETLRGSVSFDESTVGAFQMNSINLITGSLSFYRSRLTRVEMKNLTTINGYISFHRVSLTLFLLNSVTSITGYVRFDESSAASFQMNSIVDIDGFVRFDEARIDSLQMNNLASIDKIQLVQGNFRCVEMNSVTFLADDWFSRTHIVIASFESLQEIGNDCFSYCERLERMKCGELSRIGDCAFELCQSLHTMDCTFSPNITIGKDVFYLCDKITAIDTSCLSNITEYSFYGCSSLSTINLSSAVTVGACAFNRCTGLTDITAPVLEFLGEQAFSFCRGVVNISMPKLLYMGSDCFAHNTELTSIDFPGVENMSGSCFLNCYCLETVDLPARWIGERCFRYCQSLRTVVLNGATYIGPDTFDYCDYLAEVHVNNLTECANTLFYFSSLNSFYAESLEIVPKSLFEKCRRLKNIHIPACKEIKESGFAGTSCTNVIELPSVSKIGANAFRGSETVQLQIPPLKEVGDYAFAEIDRFVLNYGNESFVCEILGEFVFRSTKFDLSNINSSHIVSLSCGCINESVRSFVLPNLKIARNGAFNDLPNITRLDLPSLVTCDGSLARNCSQLANISAPNLASVANGSILIDCPSVQELVFPQVHKCDDRAFANIGSLTKLSLHSIVNISKNCFENCASLESIFAPNIRRIGRSAFMNCYSLRMINGETILNLTNVESIEPYSFYRCSAVDGMITNTETIEDHAFCGCHSLKTISISSAESIDTSAFEGCTSLESVDAPKVQTLSGGAFRDCISLQTARFEGLHRLNSDYHFYNCTNLVSIYLVSLETIPEKSENIFGNCLSLRKIWLPSTPVSTLHANVFINTGRDMIDINGVKVMNIIMCASSYSSYSCSGPGCGEHQWKYLYSGETDDYESECGYASSAGWLEDHIWLIVMIVVTAVIGTVVAVSLSILFRRQKKKQDDYDRNMMLTRLVLDDFG